MKMSKKKRQFRGTSKPKDYYDRKVIRTSHTVSLSMGHIIPKTWRYVRLKVEERSENHILLRITKLLGDENYARIEETHKRGK